MQSTTKRRLMVLAPAVAVIAVLTPFAIWFARNKESLPLWVSLIVHGLAALAVVLIYFYARAKGLLGKK